MNRFFYSLILFLTGFFSGAFNLHAANNPKEQVFFEKIFKDWTSAFNQKQLAPTCALFSKEMTASFQGAPAKTYESICDGFKKVFAQRDKSFRYRFKLHEVYQSGNLAAVRITWYFQIFQQGKLISETQDEGLDIFLRDANGQWKIVNYLAYSKP